MLRLSGLTRLTVVTAAVLGMSVPSALSQTPAQAPVQRAPDGGTWEHVDGIFMTPIPRAPFEATVLIESTRVMEDGGTMTRHTFNHVARDSEGRVRLERRQMLPASSVTVEPAVLAVILIDMEAGTRTECNAFSKLCRMLTVHRGAHAPILPAGPIGNREYLERVDLGHEQKAGMDAVGTRETLTLATDVDGNNRPMISRKEIWYSPALQINLSSTRYSPKTGTDVLTVGEINLGEPPAALLSLPAGYRLVDERTAAGGPAAETAMPGAPASVR